jgi:two-component system sensor histidine kinase KdpD
MEDESRPDPDELLQAIKHDEAKLKRGKLKIFLGMAAGVGKTYAMLEAAQRLKNSGVDVVVGIVNTHGRKETAALLEGLTIVPEKQIVYKNRNFGELNVEEIIRLKPQLAIVDELAHSNTPGSTHPKRWQDVMDLLDEGIDVLTTLNIQHIESLKDIVEGITDVTIRETVPDLVIEKTNNIELIDLTPEELLQRLKEGKVYLGNQASIAAQNFFQEEKLTALRELVLRFAAEKVDHDLHNMLMIKEHSMGWKPRERLLAAISARVDSEKVIRAARRIAFTVDAPWTVLYVDTGKGRNEREEAILSKNLSLARELGAEVITTYGSDIAEEIAKVAKENNITQIILGRTGRSGIRLLHFPGIIDKLSHTCQGIALHIIPVEEEQAVHFVKKTPLAFTQSPFLYGFIALAISSLLVGLSWFIHPYIGFAALFLIIIAICILANKVHLYKELLTKREETTRALYDIVHLIATSPSKEELIKSVCQRLGMILKGTCEMVIKDVEGNINFEGEYPLLEGPRERQTVSLVASKKQEAGWSTDTLPSDRNFYMPLRGFGETVGVLIFRPDDPTDLIDTEEKNLTYTIGRQLASYLERSLQDEMARLEEQRLQTEKIHKMILKLISNQFQSPILSLQEAIEELRNTTGTPMPKEIPLFDKIENCSDFLGRIVDNISVMAKLSSGFIPVNKKFYSIKKLIFTCCDHVKKTIDHHEFQITIVEDLPEVLFDFSLMELLLYNLLSNACKFSPDGTVVEITAHLENAYVVMSVADEGKGIPEDQLETIFETFYRLPGTLTAGVGLGLAIVKSISEIHNGHLKVENRDGGGARFSIYIPVE